MKQDQSGLSDTKSAHNTPPQKTFVSFSVTLRVKYKLHILFVVSAAIRPGEPRTVMVYACCSKPSLYTCEFCGQITQKPAYDLTPSSSPCLLLPCSPGISHANHTANVNTFWIHQANSALIFVSSEHFVPRFYNGFLLHIIMSLLK